MTVASWVGIDPGLSGGVAVLWPLTSEAQVWRMPVAGGEIDAGGVAMLLHQVRKSGPCSVVIEKVHSMPKQGVSSTFKFGCGYGMVRGVAATLGLPVHLITPQAWKAKVLAGTTKDKAAAVDYCRRIYPAVPLIPEGCRVPHDGIADALCLATYGRSALA